MSSRETTLELLANVWLAVWAVPRQEEDVDRKKALPESNCKMVLAGPWNVNIGGSLKRYQGGVGTLKRVLFKFFSSKAGEAPPPPKYISATASPRGGTPPPSYILGKVGLIHVGTSNSGNGGNHSNSSSRVIFITIISSSRSSRSSSNREVSNGSNSCSGNHGT